MKEKIKDILIILMIGLIIALGVFGIIIQNSNEVQENKEFCESKGGELLGVSSCVVVDGEYFIRYEIRELNGKYILVK